MSHNDTDQLIEMARQGDQVAKNHLLQRYRQRLRRLVAALLDPRLSARIDPSDVLQNAMTNAAQKLPGYLHDQPVGFYPWIRQIVKEELIDIHRRHLHAHRRSVLKERDFEQFFSDASAADLAERLVSREPSPSSGSRQREKVEMVKACMACMTDAEQELLFMRFAEQMTVPEIADVLGILETAARSRVRRALERLSALISKGPNEDVF